ETDDMFLVIYIAIMNSLNFGRLKKMTPFLLGFFGHNKEMHVCTVNFSIFSSNCHGGIILIALLPTLGALHTVEMIMLFAFSCSSPKFLLYLSLKNLNAMKIGTFFLLLFFLIHISLEEVHRQDGTIIILSMIAFFSFKKSLLYLQGGGGDDPPLGLDK
ncbi:hypothetical protein ACJX0J_015401, partial [Zea mays]